MIKEIQAAFDAQIATVWSGDIAYDGTPYTARSDRPYLDVSMSGQSSMQAGIGTKPPIRWTGSYTIVVYRPFGEGLQEGLAWAEIIRAAFPRGIQLPVASNGATVLNTVIERASNNGLFTSVPVIVFWFATEMPT